LPIPIIFLALLSPVVSIIIWSLHLTGWQGNVGLGVTITMAIFAAVGFPFYPQISSDLNLGLCYVVMFFIGIGASFVIACPWVNSEQAKTIAQEYVEKEKSGFRVTITRAELNNWTWHITGLLTSISNQSVKFHLNVSAKRKKVLSKLYY